MIYRIFSLHPEIFSSFFSQSLIARGLEKGVIQKEIINWREDFGIGKYKQIDDRPFGGGTGMVLMPEQIFQSLEKNKAVSPLFSIPKKEIEHKNIYPNNEKFFQYWLKNKPKKVTISMSPRGFTFNQEIAHWLSQNFEEINILCGRYEGFDARVNEAVDLELSLGDFVLNGGEVACMCLIEATARLLPGYLTKPESMQHDSFSKSLNNYTEQNEYIIGKNRLKQLELAKKNQDFHNWKENILEVNLEQLETHQTPNLFDNRLWFKEKAPFLEHPQYTRPSIWKNIKTPEFLVKGNHKLIDNWRKNWYKKESK